METVPQLRSPLPRYICVKLTRTTPVSEATTHTHTQMKAVSKLANEVQHTALVKVCAYGWIPPVHKMYSAGYSEYSQVLTNPRLPRQIKKEIHITLVLPVQICTTFRKGNLTICIQKCLQSTFSLTNMVISFIYTCMLFYFNFFHFTY